MENNVFAYSYSADRNKEVEKIRDRYLPIEENKLERLRRLDRRAQTAGVTESLVVGIVGALTFGLGMCFGLDALEGPEALTFIFGIIGVLIMTPAYPIYKRISKKTRSRLAPEILKLSDELVK